MSPPRLTSLFLCALACAACSRNTPGADAGPIDEDAGHDLTELELTGSIELQPTGDTTGVQILARCGETETTAVSKDDGTYSVTVDVEGCDPLVVEFRKASYLPAIEFIPLPPPATPMILDATLAGLHELQCDDAACVEEGRKFSEFPPGPMKQGWVTSMTGPAAVDFAGGRLRDLEGSVVWMTAFGYFDFRDAGGGTMNQFDSFEQCFRVDRVALDWLVDEIPGNGTIDMRTYELDEDRALWNERGVDAHVGYGERVDGKEVVFPADEEDLASIRSDQFEGSSTIYLCAPLSGSGWVGFGTTLAQKSCLTIKTVNSCGLPLANAAIKSEGRDHGYRVSAWSDRDGNACIEVASSEETGADHDSDGLGGESFFANIEARLDRGTERLTDLEHPQAAGTCSQPDTCTVVDLTFDTQREGCEESP